MSSVLKSVGEEGEEYSDDEDFSDDFDMEEDSVVEGGGRSKDETLQKAEDLLKRAAQKKRVDSETGSQDKRSPRSASPVKSVASSHHHHHRSTHSSPPRTPRKVEVVPPRSSSSSSSRRSTAPAPDSPRGVTVVRSRRGAKLAGTGIGASRAVKLRSTVEQERALSLSKSLLKATTGATRKSRPTTAPASKARKDRIYDLAKPRNVPPELHKEDGHANTWIRQNLVCTCVGKKKRAKCTGSLPLPGCGRAVLIHAIEDDGKNCKFKPTLSKKSRAMVQEASAGNDEGCIIRMEAKERARRSDLEETRAGNAYAVRQDKLVCPACGTEQSYAEWRDGVKRCSAEACGKGLYRPRIVWSSVETSFLRRQAEWAAKKKAAADKARQPPSTTFKARPSPRHTSERKFGFGRS